MHIVKLMGGLGNQLFEYAFAIALSKKINKLIKIDLSWFDEVKSKQIKNVDGRVYELAPFCVNPKFATNKEVEDCLNKKRCYLPKFLRKLLNKKKYTSNTVIEYQPQVFQSNLFEFTENAYYDGYFQSEKYFVEYREDILKEFSLKDTLNQQNTEMLNKILSVNAVSLHVRRGDYVNLQSTYQLCSLEYYSKSIEYIAKNVESPHFFLFSDDINWVIENLKIEYPYTVVDINDTKACCYDLELMKNCKHNIIANSSFSWWGAWLNQNRDKIVIAPKKWFAGKKLISTDIIPDSWITL